jgi:hypothetical protein
MWQLFLLMDFCMKKPWVYMVNNIILFCTIDSWMINGQIIVNANIWKYIYVEWAENNIL